MWHLDYKESWALKSWCFWNVVLEKTLESPLDCKEIQPVHPKGDQSWVLIGRTDVEAETPVLWPPDVKSWVTGKDPDSGKDWGQEEKGMTEDEMVGWPHQLDGHGFGWTPGVGDGQGGLVCCGSWGHKESWTELVAQLVKNTPAMQETWGWSLGWEDPLERGKATQSSILAWRTLWTYSTWVKKTRTQLSYCHFSLLLGELGWLQSSCYSSAVLCSQKNRYSQVRQLKSSKIYWVWLWLD